MKTYLPLLCLLVFASCENDGDEKGMTKTEPQPPPSVNYDLNNDAINDFTISYSMFVWDGIYSSGFGYSGTIKPLNENLLLGKRDAQLNMLTLLSRFNNTISREVSTPFEWNSYQTTLVSITGSANNTWPGEWTIQSDTALDFYYLGVKMKENDHFLTGWIKLEINKATGEIKIVNKKLTPNDSIVIDE